MTSIAQVRKMRPEWADKLVLAAEEFMFDHEIEAARDGSLSEEAVLVAVRDDLFGPLAGAGFERFRNITFKDVAHRPGCPGHASLVTFRSHDCGEVAPPPRMRRYAPAGASFKRRTHHAECSHCGAERTRVSIHVSVLWHGERRLVRPYLDPAFMPVERAHERGIEAAS